MFKEIMDDTNEISGEIKDFSEEVVDSDGVEELPDQIHLDDLPDGEHTITDGESHMETGSIDENEELEEKKGGSYRDVKKISDGETQEVHHMPADSASPLERDDGPAIAMDKSDHRQTASCGNSCEAREYREQQRELIEQGKFQEAFDMDVEDIREKFGDKYDDAIAQAQEYVDKLIEEEKING